MGHQRPNILRYDRIGPAASLNFSTNRKHMKTNGNADFAGDVLNPAPGQTKQILGGETYIKKHRAHYLIAGFARNRVSTGVGCVVVQLSLSFRVFYADAYPRAWQNYVRASLS